MFYCPSSPLGKLRCIMILRRTTMGSVFALLLCLFVSLVSTPLLAAPPARQFVLVIDAGHGGKDAGAVGALTQEKTINLNVALAFGKLVEQNCKDVKVVYTRKTDVFVTLQGRADIANRNKADLFVSIHTNAVATNKGGVSGAETYTLGMHRAAENLEVAKRENSVITQEANYKQVYHNFDPKRAESYIIFEFMQDRNMQQSVDFARLIQQQYGAQGRKNKGVHQAGFLVLRATSMPSVLTEVGFISHPEEEKFLHSAAGVQSLAQSLYNAFRSYQKQHAYFHHAIEAESNAPQLAENPPMSAPAPAETTLTEPHAAQAALSPVGSGADGMTAPAVTPSKAPNPTALSEATPTVAEVVPVATRPFRPTPAPTAPEMPITPAPTPEKVEKPQEKPIPSPEKGRKNKAPKAEASPPMTEKAELSEKREKAAPPPAEATSAPTPSKREKAKASKKGETPLPDAPQPPAASTEKAGKTIKTAAKDAAPQPEKAEKAMPTPAPQPSKSTVTAGAPIFKVQILSSTSRLKIDDAAFKALTGVESYQDGSTYKYTVGHSADIDEIKQLRKTVADRFPEAFVVAFVDGIRTDLHHAIQQAKNHPTPTAAAPTSAKKTTTAATSGKPASSTEKTPKSSAKTSPKK